MSSAAVKRTFFPADAPGVTRVKNWRELALAGNRMGPADAPVMIIEFSDFQCPFCKQAADVLEEIRQRHPDQVTVVYRHLPLASHRYAERAAVPDLPRSRECVQSQRLFTRVQADVRAADRLGLTGTPAFIVNGRRFTGSVPPGGWDAWIETALRKAR